ncbi:MAG: hypothetical protein JKY09_00720 [Crocinitomicaceae bacterium]|nr:hypothetical protein [Crocinitomicaceae bacterium]
MRRFFLVFSFFSLIFGCLAQPTNDDCSNATTITDLSGGCTTIDATGATFDNYTSTCQDYSNNVWFSFTAQGGDASFDITGDRPELSVSYAPTGDPCNISDAISVYCGDLTGNYSTATYSTNDLIIGETYYVQVTNNSNTSVTICITNTAAPANDACSAAEAITTLDGTCTSASTLSATSDSYEPSCWSSSLYDESHTVWYSFTAQGYEATIDINSEASSYPGVAIYSVTSGGDICNSGDVVEWDCASWGNGDYTSSSAQATGYPLTIGEIYYVAVTMEDNDDGTFNICIDNPVNPEGDNCFSATPFCTGTTETFPANTNESVIDVADYDCLASQANPAWFYLEIATAGDIEITITNSNSKDIDFILWGPFADVPSGCDPGIQSSTKVEDCSYSTATTEIVDITGALVGETYIMLITNFSNDPTDISFSQTGGLGATDCIIVLPIELIGFEGENNGSVNTLTWSTVSEFNNDYFTVERSIDNKEWIFVGNISSKGNTSENQKYKMNDRNFSEGINYYRLHQTDLDGTETDYMMISVDNSKSERELIKTINLMGQEVDKYYKGFVIDYYNDSRSIKRIQN